MRFYYVRFINCIRTRWGHILTNHTIHKTKIPWYERVVTRLGIGIILISTIVLFFTQFTAGVALNVLSNKMQDSRFESDIAYLKDTIGEGDWSIYEGGLYLGSTFIGDGTVANANTVPFSYCHRITGTDFYSFMKTSDDGLGWVGDSSTGYQQGHYIRVAGSTTSLDGDPLEGTYIQKKVADALDSQGYYSGMANVNGRQMYCSYVAIKDSDGNTVGCIVVGRGKEELNTIVHAAQMAGIAMTILVFALIAVGFIVMVRRSVGKITLIQNRLDQIGTGDFSAEPLTFKRKDEFQSIADSINNMSASLKDKERISSELELATRIQTNMLPCIFPPFPDHDEFDIYATMEPAKEVGGDFYDFFMLDEKRLAVVCADVSGKGVPAALFMVISKTLIKNYTQLGMEPANVFTKVNQLLYEEDDMGLFVTAWMGVLDTSTGKLTYVNAGHTRPMLKQADGNYVYLKSAPGFVLAGLNTTRYKQNELTMAPGDKLLLYTDGVTEATNSQEELYGEERLSQCMNKHLDENAETTLKSLRKDIGDFVEDAEQFDDITILMLEYIKYHKDDKMNRKYYEADVNELPKVNEFIEGELEAVKCPPKIMMQINVALEEMFVNVCHYAYPGETGKVSVGIDADADKATIEIADFGIPFDPLAKADPNITLDAEDRQIGGLGIYIVKKTMDDVSYVRADKQNILTFTKKLK